MHCYGPTVEIREQLSFHAVHPLPQGYTSYKPFTVQDCAKYIILCASCSIIESRLFSTNKVPLESRCSIHEVIYRRRAACVCTAADATSHCLGQRTDSLRVLQVQLLLTQELQGIKQLLFIILSHPPTPLPQPCLSVHTTSLFHDFLCSFPLLVLPHVQFLLPYCYSFPGWKMANPPFSFIYFSVWSRATKMRPQRSLYLQSPEG